VARYTAAVLTPSARAVSRGDSPCTTCADVPGNAGQKSVFIRVHPWLILAVLSTSG
jgi:hypothetical protein